MIVRITRKYITTVTVSTFALLFCSFALAQQPSTSVSVEDGKTSTTFAQSPVVQERFSSTDQEKAIASRQEDHGSPGQMNSSENSLTFLDDEQTWRDEEAANYEEWLNRNPRYSHPIFQSQWDISNQKLRDGKEMQGTGPQRKGNSKPGPTFSRNHWGSSTSTPWFSHGGVSGYRSRIIWTNDRYITGRYYGGKSSD